MSMDVVSWPEEISIPALQFTHGWGRFMRRLFCLNQVSFWRVTLILKKRRNQILITLVSDYNDLISKILFSFQKDY